jgi:hypothetical protein
MSAAADDRSLDPPFSDEVLTLLETVARLKAENAELRRNRSAAEPLKPLKSLLPAQIQYEIARRCLMMEVNDADESARNSLSRWRLVQRLCDRHAWR